MGYKKLLSSGLVNIGCIPENWYVAKINYFSKLQTGGTPNKDIIEYWENGNVNWMSSGEVNNEFIFKTKHKITELGMKNSNASILPINSVMMALNGQGKTKGTVAVLKVETTCNQSLAAFITDENHLHYLYLYYFLKYNYKFIRGLVGDGLRDGISMGLLKSLKICLPTYEEQRTIGEFLYKKEQEIKTLIEQKESLIRLLEQQRQSIITEAVTKGLNPNVKMKDSGVEWIGEVPEHWDEKALKYCFKIGNGKEIENEIDKEEDGIVVYGSGGVFKKTDKVLYNGESVLFGRKGTIGKPLYINGAFWTVDTMYYTKFSTNSSPKWFYYLLLIYPWDLIVTQTALPSVVGSDVANTICAIPPLEEQKQIADYLSKKDKKFFDLKSSIEQQIEKLKEYRQSLIYEAVTGKIDVRDMELDEVR